jgi:hypothetical protein
MTTNESGLPQNTVKKHRTTPISDSLTSVPGYPEKLVIYQLAASPYWWVRYYIDKRVVRRSTKTTDKRKAIAFAKEFYDEINYKRRQGLSITSQSQFEICADEVMAAQEARVQRGEISKMMNQSDGYRLKKLILPFFRKYDVGQIDYFLLEQFLNKLGEEKLASPTIANYFGLIRKILAYAERRGFIQSIPQFPKFQKTDKPRGWFSTREYRKIWESARRLRGKTFEIREIKEGEIKQTIVCEEGQNKEGTLLRRVEMTEDLYQLIVFMTNSFIRPSDIKFIQHKHVEIIENDDTYLRLSIPTTKKHGKPIVTMEKAVEVYKRLTAYHAQRGLAEKEDYLFLPEHQNRTYALRMLQRQFDIVLQDTKLKTGPRDEERSLYSLRHTCIMYRLLYGQGLDLLTLARNARTSPEMIDRFYASHLSGEMNIKMIQSKRSKK